MLQKLPIMLFSNAPDFTLLCPKFFPIMPMIMLYHVAQKTRTLFNLTFVIINLCYMQHK